MDIKIFLKIWRRRFLRNIIYKKLNKYLRNIKSVLKTNKLYRSVSDPKAKNVPRIDRRFNSSRAFLSKHSRHILIMFVENK